MVEDMANEQEAKHTEAHENGHLRRVRITLTAKQLNRIKRAVNVPVRGSKRNEKRDAQAIESFISLTLSRELQNADEVLEGIRGELLTMFNVDRIIRDIG